MSKHTPGPWYADLYCVWAGIGRQHYVAGTCCGSGEDGEQKANARLIAAAPDLLSALAWAISALEPPIHNGENGGPISGYGIEYAAARAAIAKATERAERLRD